MVSRTHIHHTIRTMLVFMLLSGCIMPRTSADGSHEAGCDKALLFASVEDDSIDLNYAPDRNVDILNLKLDITPDFQNRTITGRALIRFAPIAFPLEELKLDAVDLNIHSVVSTPAQLEFQVTTDQLIVTFASPIEVGSESEVTIKYDAEPRHGLYFRTPEMGYPEGNTHLFTQGQPYRARHWYVSFDSPNEKFTSEITCRVPDGMTVLSNGRLVSKTPNESTGLTAFHWRQDKPHPNYLIALCAGYFEKIEDTHNELALAFYTLPSHFEYAANSFRNTKTIMTFFEKEIGVPYPWDKYDQVVVDDFLGGGMENTSLTILTTRTLFPDEIGNLRNSDWLVAHELAHQWFGDYITCKDWSHVWLNEGFATYYDRLSHGEIHGRDSMNYRLLEDLDTITSRDDPPRPIVSKEYDSPWEQFSFRTYLKGSWVLHMLRSQLGEGLFRQCIRTYVERHALGNVVTEDLNRVIEELSGRSFDRYFDQWIYRARHPELEIEYEWLAKKKMARINVTQVQESSDDVYLFHFPLNLRFKGPSGVTDDEVRITERQHHFYVPLAGAPEIVRVDPGLTLLAKIDFKKPDPMYFAQLGDEDDAIGRILACRALADKDDKRSAEALEKTLNSDSFFGVRIAASRALREIRTEEAFTALLASTEQADDRVRRQVVGDASGFFRDESIEATRRFLGDEKNPEIAADQLRSLGKYPTGSDEVRPLLLRYLEKSSFRQTLAAGALDAIRLLDDPSYAKPVMKLLRKKEADFPSGKFTAGLDTLAWISRNEDEKSDIREFIEGYVNHQKENIRIGAITALGILRDTRAIGVVQSFAGDDSDDPVQKAAVQALVALNEAKKVPVELSDLRTEVMELKEETGSLKDKVRDLEDQAAGEKKSGGERRKFLGIF
jgi:aminopeptidase N